MSLQPEEVTAVIVTRGDVDLSPIFDTLIFPTCVVWDNAQADDLKVFGRYAATCIVETPVVYTQDDDCIVSPDVQHKLVELYRDGEIICNMPDGHNAGHPHLKLLGWGSLWDRALPFHAFQKWIDAGQSIEGDDWLLHGCDIVMSTLSAGCRYDLGHEERPFSHDANRNHNQPGYAERKQWFYEAACELLVGAE